jgi:2,4-dienoyl-CoA reductase-like NADH-dependent reductase (Old Yellow Enzyme family)/thioredoxin reductase
MSRRWKITDKRRVAREEHIPSRRGEKPKRKGGTAMQHDFSILFQPLQVGTGARKLKLKNRMVMPPMVTCTANTIGEVTQRMVDYYVERAKGGVGTIIVEAMDIDDKMLFNRLGIFHDRFINELEYLATSIKEAGARAFGQINETGIRGYLPGPDDLSVEEIKVLIEAYGQAADRVKRAGFEGVEIHGAHGYLISEFLAPVNNHRKDDYGGDRTQRTKFAQEVIRSVRAAVGPDFPVCFRMNGDDYLEGGVKIEDAVVTAQKAEEAGADIIHVSAGVGIMAHDLSLANEKSYFHMVQPMYLPRGCLVHLAAEVKKVVKVPVMTVGRINDPDVARDALEQGKADLVAMGRALIADPYFPRKTAEGRIGDIRKCIACNYCHGKRIRPIKHLHCAVNPLAGREAESRNVKPAETPKQVMIVGGGVAGMEAARWLKKRGHQPAIYEKTDRLGGQLLLACVPPHKDEIETFRQFLVTQMGKLEVPINFMTEVTPELVLEKRPEALIVAIGGRQAAPSIPINNKMTCLYSWDVISGKETIKGEKVVVLGGGFVASEIAEFIAEQGKKVTILEMRDLIAFDMEPMLRAMLMKRLGELKVNMVPNTLVQEVTQKGVLGKNVESGAVKEFPADTVVIAFGSVAVGFPTEEIEKAGIEVQVIGDAKEINGIPEATRAGFIAGTTI